ncbi:NmrA-like family [Pluteus cervinus]|uniref:NmrA-like family n=1 Tax=Pluteus cervinus TaxID=181527 RepID=A0ACD3A834_9AGAR|nr:NmrA-like family [Pluteus cervinus]
MSKGILILGGGELGTAIIASLATHPSRPPLTPITVILRSRSTSPPNPNSSESPNSKALQLAELSSLPDISLIQFDITSTSISTLASLFSGYAIIISCVGMGLPKGSQLKITEAALQANIPKFLPWQFGVDYDKIGRGSVQDLFTEQLDVRALLRGQKSEETKTHWVIVSVGMFMSFVFEDEFGVVRGLNARGGGKVEVRPLGEWENKLTLTDVKDIGRVVAELIFVAPEVVDQVVYVAGETLSFTELANTIEKVTGREVERVRDWSLDTLKNEWKEDAGNVMKKYRVVFAEQVGITWEEKGSFNAQQRMEMGRIADWLRKKLV